MDLPPFDDVLRAKEAHLRSILAAGGRTLVAYSGGVDSGYLAVLAHELLGNGVTAVLAASASLADWEREEALAFAAEQGLPVRVLETRELENPDYRANAPDRCFFCKQELFQRMEALAAAEDFQTLVYGGNRSDLGEERPGAEAARRYRVRAPLAEAGLEKGDIRRLAQARGLSIWDRPARACLASRIPHFSEVTAAKLGQLGQAEKLLHDLGFRDYRVRHHGQLARLELGGEEWGRLAAPALARAVDEGLRALGFGAVSLDLRPFSSGSLSRLSRNALTEPESIP
jgi:uncharacterized protein